MHIPAYLLPSVERPALSDRAHPTPLWLPLNWVISAKTQFPESEGLQPQNVPPGASLRAAAFSKKTNKQAKQELYSITSHFHHMVNRFQIFLELRYGWVKEKEKAWRTWCGKREKGIRRGCWESQDGKPSLYSGQQLALDTKLLYVEAERNLINCVIWSQTLALLYPHTCRLAGVVGPAGQALTLHSSKTRRAQTGPLSQNSITRVDPDACSLARWCGNAKVAPQG